MQFTNSNRDISLDSEFDKLSTIHLASYIFTVQQIGDKVIPRNKLLIMYTLFLFLKSYSSECTGRICSCAPGLFLNVRLGAPLNICAAKCVVVDTLVNGSLVHCIACKLICKQCWQLRGTRPWAITICPESHMCLVTSGSWE